MQLQPGEKLGPYEILALIGKGGMGEVCPAHDSWERSEAWVLCTFHPKRIRLCEARPAGEVNK